MHSLTRQAKVSALIVVKIKTRTPVRGEGWDSVPQKASRLLVFYQETKKEKSLAIIRQNTTAAILVLHGVTWRKSLLVCLASCGVRVFSDTLVVVHVWIFLLPVLTVTLVVIAHKLSKPVGSAPCVLSFDYFWPVHTFQCFATAIIINKQFQTHWRQFNLR